IQRPVVSTSNVVCAVVGASSATIERLDALADILLQRAVECLLVAVLVPVVAHSVQKCSHVVSILVHLIVRSGSSGNEKDQRGQQGENDVNCKMIMFQCNNLY